MLALLWCHTPKYLENIAFAVDDGANHLHIFTLRVDALYLQKF